MASSSSFISMNVIGGIIGGSKGKRRKLTKKEGIIGIILSVAVITIFVLIVLVMLGYIQP